MAAKSKSSTTRKSARVNARSRSAGKNAVKSTAKRAAGSSAQSGTARRRGSLARTTTDHDEIRQWAEARGGVPACVRGTGGRGDVGMIRIDFPTGPEPKLQDISWDDWFQKFDENNLALLYQEKTSGGRPSRFNKLVSRESESQTRTAARRAG